MDVSTERQAPATAQLVDSQRALVLVPAAVLDELLSRMRSVDAELAQFRREREAVGKPELLSLNDVCALFRVRRSVVRRLIDRGELPAGRIPTPNAQRQQYRIRRVDAERVLGFRVEQAAMAASA